MTPRPQHEMFIVHDLSLPIVLRAGAAATARCCATMASQNMPPLTSMVDNFCFFLQLCCFAIECHCRLFKNRSLFRPDVVEKQGYLLASPCISTFCLLQCQQVERFLFSSILSPFWACGTALDKNAFDALRRNPNASNFRSRDQCCYSTYHPPTCCWFGGSTKVSLLRPSLFFK